MAFSRKTRLLLPSNITLRLIKMRRPWFGWTAMGRKLRGWRGANWRLWWRSELTISWINWDSNWVTESCCKYFADYCARLKSKQHTQTCHDHHSATSFPWRKRTETHTLAGHLERESLVKHHADISVFYQRETVDYPSHTLPFFSFLRCYPPGLQFVITYFACITMGIIAVPTYPADISRAKTEIPRFCDIKEAANSTTALTEQGY